MIKASKSQMKVQNKLESSRKGQITPTSIYFFIGTLLAIIVIVAVLLPMLTDLYGSKEFDKVTGFIELNEYLNSYEDNIDQRPDDEVMFSIPEDYTIVAFNKDMKNGERIENSCKRNYFVKGESDNPQEKNIIIETEKPEECGAKACICLIEVTGKYRSKYKERLKVIPEDRTGSCFFYDELSFKNSDSSTYVCENLAIIDSMFLDYSNKIFGVKLDYQGEDVTLKTPIQEYKTKSAPTNKLNYDYFNK